MSERSQTGTRRATEQAAGGMRLTREDLAILELETERVAGHACKILRLGGAIDIERLRAAITSRLDAAPRLSLRLGDVDGEPWWIADPAMNVADHVVQASAARDEADFLAAVAHIFAQHLDRSRPLWRIDVIPLLADGGSALIWRFHHALADGMTAMQIARDVLWDEEQASRHATAASRARRRATARPGPHHRLGGLMSAAREAPQPWLRSPFDGHIGARRSVALATLELGQVKSIARAVDGATVNDVVLALVAGGLRRWIEDHHGHLGTIRVKVPVSLHNMPDRPAAGGPEPGNRDSFFCLDLPLGSAEPLDRLAEISRATRIRKQEHDAQHLDALARRLTRTPRLSHFADQVLAHPRSFALNVSNVPGPRRPVQVLGTPVTAMYTLAEIGEHHALRLAVVSLAGTLNFGFVADPTILPDVDRLARDVRAEAGEFAAILPST
ncbi:MAG: wax ester/triacylglycerol synthase domain-containing protein [Streptosporangiaceae bacterium]